MYRNNRNYKVYSERPADLFHFHSGVAMVGCSFVRFTVGTRLSDCERRALKRRPSYYRRVSRRGRRGWAPRRNDAPHPVCVHSGRSYLSFRVQSALRFTLVPAIEWKAECISILFTLLSLYYFVACIAITRHIDIPSFIIDKCQLYP